MKKGLQRRRSKISWIVNNSSLSVDDVRTSHDLEYYREEIQNILNAYPAGCTAYNNEFDFGFLDVRGI